MVDPTPQHIQTLLSHYRGYHTTKLLSIGVSLGIFSELGKQVRALKPDQLAAHLSLDSHFVETWCQAARAFGLIERDEGGVFLSSSQGEAIEEIGGHSVYCVATGHDMSKYESLFESGDSLHPSQRHATYMRGVMFALKPVYRFGLRTILPQIDAHAHLRDIGGKILELGFGGGYGLVELARQYPKAQVEGVDVDEQAFSLAHKTLEEAGLGHRIALYKPEDVEAKEETYDLLYSSMMLHELEDPVSVLGSHRKLIKPGGELVLVDSVPTRKSSPLTSIDLLVWGLAFDEAMHGAAFVDPVHARDYLKEAGYANIRQLDTSQRPWVFALSAQTPL